MNIISLISVNNPGFETALKIAHDLLLIDENFKINIYFKGEKTKNHAKFNLQVFSCIDEIMENVWQNSTAIIWFTATGIVVRKIARFLKSKTHDPAVLVMNIPGTQIIPLLSGHIGGANKLAEQLTQINPNLTAFMTTATDSLNAFAFDNFAQNSGYEILNIEKLAKISNALINQLSINLITYPKIRDIAIEKGLKKECFVFFDIRETPKLRDVNKQTVVISPFFIAGYDDALKIKIKPIALGIGLNKNTDIEELESDVLDFLDKNDLNIYDITSFGSFEAKKNEQALIKLAEKYEKKLLFFDENQINRLDENFSSSKANKFFNIKGVAEPSAILAAPCSVLFIKKTVYKNTTIAAAF